MRGFLPWCLRQSTEIELWGGHSEDALALLTKRLFASGEEARAAFQPSAIPGIGGDFFLLASSNQTHALAVMSVVQVRATKRELNNVNGKRNNETKKRVHPFKITEARLPFVIVCVSQIRFKQPVLHTRAFNFSLAEEDIYRLKVYGIRLTALPVTPTSARAGMRCHLVSLQVATRAWSPCRAALLPVNLILSAIVCGRL